MPAYDEVVQKIDFEKRGDKWFAMSGPIEKLPDQQELDYRTMLETLKDYVKKTGFEKVLLGLSGGIDSALVAAIAVDALGSKNVRCVMLPSEFTSESSLSDARAVAQNLDCSLNTIPISEPKTAVNMALRGLFQDKEIDVTEENIQSRLRGLLLMAMSNKFGEMLLTTGNKSEVAVGYSTIYGDMSGGYNPLKDLYKTKVFEISRWRNLNHRSWMLGSNGVIIPETILTKAPTAELRDNQKDQDSLPDYEVLDAILMAFIDDEKSVAEIVKMGFDRKIVKDIEDLIYKSEYKRYQSAPGTKLSGRAFWLDRRYPIANKWRDNS
jgi:NAD+ synthase